MIFDTNIVIYLFKNDPHIITFVERLATENIFISIVTWIEALGGSSHHGKSIREFQNDLSDFQRIPIDGTIAITAAQLIQNGILHKRKLHFQDAVIAATALTHKMPLVSNNEKDFRHIKGLKLVTPK